MSTNSIKSNQLLHSMGLNPMVKIGADGIKAVTSGKNSPAIKTAPEPVGVGDDDQAVVVGRKHADIPTVAPETTFPERIQPPPAAAPASDAPSAVDASGSGNGLTDGWSAVVGFDIRNVGNTQDRLLPGGNPQDNQELAGWGIGGVVSKPVSDNGSVIGYATYRDQEYILPGGLVRRPPERQGLAAGVGYVQSFDTNGDAIFRVGTDGVHIGLAQRF